MPQNVWLLSDDALQVRKIRTIREARSPLVARSRGEAPKRTLPVAYSKDGTATIRVEGLLTPTPDMQAEFYGEANTTYTDLQAALSEALDDKKTKEIVWLIDSPGGAVDGLFSLLDDIADARASGGKPMRSEAVNAHSAAYGIAAAVGRISAVGRMSSFGSVGVATSSFVQGGLCGEVVDLTNSDAPEKRPNVKTPEGREVVVRYLDQLAAEFMGAIAAGRGVTRDHVALKYGRGSSMLASAAKDAGLIDEISPRASARVRTDLTNARTADIVPGPMADPTPVPEANSTDTPSEPAAVALPEVQPIPITLDVSDADRAELAAFRSDLAARETAERRALITSLVELQAETPATAWRDGAPVPRLAAETLDDMRARVAVLRAARPASAVQLTAPAVAEFSDLSEVEARDAAKIKDPDARARYIATRRARKASAAAKKNSAA